MSNPNIDLVANLKTATFWINRTIPPFQIAFGTFGNLLNIIIFTRRALRTNPCSMYFLVGSINNIVVINVALLTRYLSTNWNLDLAVTNNILCKLRSIFVYASLCLTLWFTVLASIDRFLSSSENVRLRQLSSLPNARKIIMFTTIFICLIHAHILVFFKSGANGSAIICAAFSNEYSIFFYFFLVIVACILPILLTTILGILMIVNVRNVHNRVVARMNDTRMRSNDRQMIRMLLFQVLFTILTTLPFSILSLYNLITVTILKNKPSTSEQAISTFATNLFLLFYYTNPVVGFYIYTLTGSRFRAEMKSCIQYGLRSVLIGTGLIQYLPFRTQRALFGENHMNINNILTRNVVHPIQHRKSRNATTAV